MRSRRPLFSFLGLAVFIGLWPTSAHTATLLVLQFHNASKYADLNWVGESVAQKLQLELRAGNQIVLNRESRNEGLRRLSLRPDADFTKATLIKLGQSLDVDYLCYGSFDVVVSPGGASNPAPSQNAAFKDSSVQIASHFLDLRKMRDGRDFSEAGKLTELSRLSEHLAWQALAFLDPGTSRPVDQFLSPQKFVRLEAEESYARGLLSTSPEQQSQWFHQANILDPHFAGPAYELGRLAADKKDYRQVINWLGRIPASDPRYLDARFHMGLAAYHAGDYNASANYNREVLKSLPLGEVFNNLGAAENQMNAPSAVDDLRRAADGDGNDSIYLFNLGAVLLKSNQFEEAARRLKAVLDRDPDDAQARTLFERANRREGVNAGAKPLMPDRLKQNFDETAFRQLKVLLQPKGSA